MTTNLKTFSLAKLSILDIDQALVNGGYTDNRLLSATFVRRQEGALVFVYKISYVDGNKRGSGNVYVSLNEEGVVIADF